MNISESARRAAQLLQLAVDASRLPVARLHFERARDPEHVAATYANFTRRHPRYRIIRNKSIGIALLDLRRFAHRDDYLASVSRKDYAAYHGRRALRRGYTLHEIDRNAHIDAIHRINVSLGERQGRPMDAAYLHKPSHYETRAHFRYFGVLDRDGQLAAYCNIAVFGNFAATDQLLGYKNNHGVMYLLVMEIICQLIDAGQLHYFMYDSFFGAQEGLRNFKRRLGFQPYRVQYSMS